jgi:hypothetical protein
MTRNDVNRIKAKHVQPGMMLCFSNPFMDVIVDDVAGDRDNEIKITTGYSGTGVDYYGADDIVWVRWP